MKKYDFDEIIDRRNTNAVKVEACRSMFGTSDVIPLWVADMDFRTPDFILESIRKRCEHPILGYSVPPRDYFTSIINWLKENHAWEVKKEWLGFMPGVVPGLSFAVQQFTAENDEIVIQPPVYFPFMHVVEKNNRKLIFNPLKEIDDKFQMDFDDLEKKITSKTKMLILCNPHNPGGRSWEKETLLQLAEICFKHGLLVVSDEIHADMALPGNVHVPFASVSENAANISLTYMSPSKTFNIPALQTSYFVIPNEQLRNHLKKFLDQSELDNGNIFAYLTTIAAYTEGKSWKMQMLDYVQKNIDFVIQFLKNEIPQIKPMKPEASFLIWLDCSGLEMNEEELFHFFIHKAGLGLNQGITFGPGGEQHLRINVACPQSILEKAMNQLKNAVKNL